MRDLCNHIIWIGVSNFEIFPDCFLHKKVIIKKEVICTFELSLFKIYWCLKLFLLKFTMHVFFYKRHFFSTQHQCSITFAWIQLRMLPKCCLGCIIVPRHFLHLSYFCSYLDLQLYMSYLCDLFFIFNFIFILINRIISWVDTHVLFIFGL